MLILNVNIKYWLELKVLSYWNLNSVHIYSISFITKLKVLSYWNLNEIAFKTI